MSYQPISGQVPDPWIKSARLEPFINNCYRPALDQLGRAYAACHPAVILVSQGKIGPRLVIDRFLERMDQDVTVVRIGEDCVDGISCMRQIAKGIGFDPVRTTLNNLESVLEMFLVFQRSKKLRTILCFENPKASDWWIQDKIRRLVELESREKFGLMIVRSVFPSAVVPDHEQHLGEIDPRLAERIILSPFTLAETRNFVRQKLQHQDGEHFQVEDVTQIFEYYAVKLIHDYSNGVPEYVERLCNRCLRLMRDTGEFEVTADTVRTAADLLGMNISRAADSTDGDEREFGDVVVPPGQLVVQQAGESRLEIPLTQNCILIGRDRLCGICVTGLKVSRYHALVAMSPQGLQFLDLGSTNGSRVNGRKVARCTLQDGDVIGIDQVTIRYVAGGEAITWTSENHADESFDHRVEAGDGPINHIGNGFNGAN